MARLVERIIELGFLLALIYLLTGCATIKGLAHDASWTADKIDQSIVVPSD